jgi:hypothetical protein
MTDEELENLKCRFGSDMSVWPAPYRHLAQSRTHEDPLDRLVREAAVEHIDGDVSARLLRQINAGRRARPFDVWSAIASPRLGASVGAVLFGTAVLGGYGLATIAQQPSSDTSLFALATGAPTIMGDILDDDDDNVGRPL